MQRELRDVPVSGAEDTNLAGDEDRLPRQKFLRNRVDMRVFLEKEIICM